LNRLARRLAAAWLLFAATGCGQILGMDETYGDIDEVGQDGASGPPGSNPPGSNDDAANPNTEDDAGNPNTQPDAPGSDGTASPVSKIARVISGTMTLAAGASTQSVTLAGIDPSRAFVVFGTRFSSTSTNTSAVSAAIVSSTELRFARAGTTSLPAIAVQYYVAEFQSGVRVFRGSTAMAQTAVTVNLPANIDRKKSFPLLSYRNTGTSYGLDDFVRARFTAANALTLSNGLASTTGIVEWQVVEFEGASVLTGELTLDSGDANAHVTLPTEINPDATMLLTTNQVANLNGTAAELLVSGRVSSSTQLTFERSLGGSTNQVTWYAVSFTNGTTVQHPSLSLGDSASSASAAIAHVDPLRSIPLTGGVWQHRGTTTLAASNNLGYGSFTLDIAGGAQIAATRAASGTSPGASALACSVVQFF
jgi:hypothetical protein